MPNFALNYWLSLFSICSTAEDHVTDIPGPIRCTIEKVNENGVSQLWRLISVLISTDENTFHNIFKCLSKWKVTPSYLKGYIFRELN